MQEIWKDIKDYEGLYQVSNLGRIKSCERIVKRGDNHKPVKERILKMGDKCGYKYVILSKSGKGKTGWVHRLVAQAFISNPDNLSCINHKDENPTNNRVDNLEWCTYRYNNTYNDIAKRRMLNVDYAKRAANTDWKARKEHTDFVQRTKNTDYVSIGLKHRKPIYQYDIYGKFIKRWECVYDICVEYNVKPEAIRANCLGKCKVTVGYMWRYEKDVKNL